MSKAIFFDSSRCSACKGCQVACKCWNNLPSPMDKNVDTFTGSYQSPIDLNGDTRLIITFDEKAGGQTGVEWSFGRRSCMHCYNPACAAVCPSGALFVDEESGMVGVDEDKCIGCQYCSSACPFDVPRYHGAQSKVNKCNGCLDRVEQGRDPACVKTCLPGALKFGDRDEMIALAEDRVATLQSNGYSDASIYGVDELDGTHVISVLKYDIGTYSLPADPKVNDLVPLFDVMGILTGVGAAAIVAGLGISFLTGIGYRRDNMRYDEKHHDVIDVDTGKVIKHIDEPEGKE